MKKIPAQILSAFLVTTDIRCSTAVSVRGAQHGGGAIFGAMAHAEVSIQGHAGAYAGAHSDADAHGLAGSRESGGGTQADARGALEVDASSAAVVKQQLSLESAFGSEIMKMLLWKGPTRHRMTKEISDKMELADALHRVEGKLPREVASLVKLTEESTNGKVNSDFDEGALGKARKILNGMIEASQQELDSVLLECKEFEERNRGTFGQVTTDLARLGAQIADLSRKRVESNEGINGNDADRLRVEAELQKATLDHSTTKLSNEQELATRHNDLQVFNFILEMVRCQEDELLQVIDAPAESVAVCRAGSNDVGLRFTDPKLQAKFERLLTPSARKALRDALGQDGVRHSSFAQSKRGPDDEDEEEEEIPPNITTSAFPTYTEEMVPVVEEPPAGQQWKKCTDETNPDCGLLHDTMSIQWGKFKDLVDELTYEISKNDDAFKKLTDNLNEQLTMLADGKTKSMEMLAETISNINADTGEMDEKDTQHHDLESAYTNKMAECKSKVEEILFTNICAVRNVRNALMTHSQLSPPAKISDCDVADWVAEECSMDCDDACPKKDPYACGGSQTLSREVIVSPNAFGALCPPLQTKKKCNQFKCPIDCVVSEWSGWSKCSRECEGGVQQKTRSILTKAKHGGEGCDTSTEERSCNTGSCDRDCSLMDWSDWSGCTTACGGGVQERARPVLVPIRGNGKCPTASNPDRLGKRECNTIECAGDEFCVAREDLIVALDSSGSMRKDGFDTLRDFAANLTGRYKSLYFGKDMMKVGLAVFGNGKVRSDGTIAPALNMQALTSDIDLVKARILETPWQKGLTNMAQAFTLADTMFSQGGRADAQSAVMVISDGKYSFRFQTALQVQKLKDKGVKIFMAVVAGGKDENLKVMKSWASQPVETNYERIPGFLALEHNKEAFAGTLVAKFCSRSFSPSVQQQKDEMVDYMMIHEGGTPDGACAVSTSHGAGLTVDQCAEKAREAYHNGFSFSKGACTSSYIDVPDGMWTAWQVDRTSPDCFHGAWVQNPYWDTYYIRPLPAAPM